MKRAMEKPAFQIDSETLKLLDDTARKIGVSRSDLIRMAIKEKLYRLGVLKPEGLEPPEQSNPKNLGRGGA